MNLVECYIENVLSVVDKTPEFVTYMQTDGGYPDFVPGEPYLEVLCNVNCYGSKTTETHLWKKSDYEKYLEQGYYLA
ncbi:hypothetical protein [Clostridium sp. HBUAS56010]|uniref:hypothetical protein n=1 Tax=Clostridium sp. HBUAS56010 TaxID=2571127 RepID=UPI0011777C04|nr:hypothetical protein [Clostridium sp. HBUAS56010]